MQATRYLESAIAIGMQNHAEVHERWIGVMHAFCSRFGVGHMTMSSDTRLDMLLRSLEEEALQAIRSNAVGIGFGADIHMSLSEQWVLRTYESVRAACDIARKRDEPRDKLVQLRELLELVRMPIAKREIANPKKLPIDGLMLVREGDGPEKAEPYVNDGSYIPPRRICLETGSVIWFPIDIRTRQVVGVRRRDLSDAMLSVLD
ncbi:MAG: hypothetical protein K0S56_1608 [Microvirga sp.]|jgi:hypothetical protein|nr:hypothetical protein [Microvirga sp.]